MTLHKYSHIVPIAVASVADGLDAFILVLRTAAVVLGAVGFALMVAVLPVLPNAE